MGQLVDTVQCIRCRQVKPVTAMRKSARAKRGHYLYCAACDNKTRRDQRVKGVNPDRKELRRKLPPYATLKRLYCDNGWSYSDIAEKYDVNRSAVYETMKRRARRYGDTWPLPTRVPTTAKMKRTLAKDTVDPVIIIEMVFEFIEMDVPKHLQRNKWKQQRIKRKTGKRIPLHKMQSPLNRSIEAFCKKHGFTPSYLKDVRAGRYQTISKQYAARLLAAIGEPVRDDLLTRRPKKYAGYSRKAA